MVGLDDRKHRRHLDLEDVFLSIQTVVIMSDDKSLVGGTGLTASSSLDSYCHSYSDSSE